MRKHVLLLMLSIFMGVHAAAATVAYWRFEAGSAGTNVSHAAGAGVWASDIADVSGNNYALSVWETGGGAGYVYRANSLIKTTIPQTNTANTLCVKNTGGGPAMWTSPTAAIRTITLAQWTIEVSVKLENGGYRTIVGRDSQGTVLADQALAALYLQAIPNNALAIKFCDVAGIWHQAVSATNVFQGYNYSTDPDGNLATWYNIAAVSDGTLLSLYLDDVAAGTGYQLIAQTNMTGSSTNTALTAGAGSGGDWQAGNWTVGRGLYNGGHTDRAWGYIDEVRISSAALAPDEFLFYELQYAGVVTTPADLVVHEEGPTGADLFFSLENLPAGNVTLTIGEQDGRGQVMLNHTTLTFTTGNWNVPQTFHVTAVDDAVLENAEQWVPLSIAVSSADPRYNGLDVAPVIISVADNECGAWGYALGDFNRDCLVDFHDFISFAQGWLDCSDPDQAGCTNFGGN